jgi:recombination protein RecR
MCAECKRFFQKKHPAASLCKVCADPNRDRETVMLVQRDIDLESVESKGNYKGVYFVLGGSVPILEKEPEKRIRVKEFKSFMAKKLKEGLKEVILGVNWNPEGENTGDYAKKIIESMDPKRQIKISHLGKGLSMGTELEYADGDTLKNALNNRN